MSKAKELIEALSEDRKSAESTLFKNLEDKSWVEAALKKMGKKWLFSGDVNAFEYGGTWWKWDGRNVEAVSISGLDGGPGKGKIAITDNSYDVRDIMKNGPDVVGYTDATGGGREEKPENQIANIIYGMLSYSGGDTNTFDVEDEDDEKPFWDFMKKRHGVTEQ